MNDEDILIKKVYTSLWEFPIFTNIKYAGNIILYATSFEDVVSKTERLIIKFQSIGLVLNMKKTEMLRSNPNDDECILRFMEIGNEFVKILNDTDSHRYL